jgi:hypothetical protein
VWDAGAPLLSLLLCTENDMAARAAASAAVAALADGQEARFAAEVVQAPGHVAALTALLGGPLGEAAARLLAAAVAGGGQAHRAALVGEDSAWAPPHLAAVLAELAADPGGRPAQLALALDAANAALDGPQARPVHACGRLHRGGRRA